MVASSRGGTVVPVLVLAALGILLSGCVHHYHRGPVPVRAHMHRYHHQGLVLIFDRDLGCYSVQDHPDHYFHDGHYYRYHDAAWQSAARVKGPWVSARARAHLLPPGLRRHHGQRVREAVHERREEGRDERGKAMSERREDAHERRAERREAIREPHAEGHKRRAATPVRRAEPSAIRNGHAAEVRGHRAEQSEEIRDPRPQRRPALKKRRGDPQPPANAANEADDARPGVAPRTRTRW